MDAQAIGPVEKSTAQVSRGISSSGSKIPSGGSTVGAQTDTVSLSQRGQAAVSQQVQSNGGGKPGSELRKIERIIRNKKDVKIILRDPPLIEEIKEVYNIKNAQAHCIRSARDLK